MYTSEGEVTANFLVPTVEQDQDIIGYGRYIIVTNWSVVTDRFDAEIAGWTL